MKKRIVLLMAGVILTLTTLKVQAQLSNFHTTQHFIASCNYDLDTKQSGPVTEVNSKVIIDIGEDGSGKLILYINDKTVFDIESTDKIDNISHKVKFNCKNYNGKYVPAGMHFTKENDGDYIDAVWITDTKNNTQIIFYK